MKKLFISVPMRNRTEYDIKASMEQMHKIAEAVFGEELEVILILRMTLLRIPIWLFGISARASRNCRKQTALSAFMMQRRSTMAASLKTILQNSMAYRSILLISSILHPMSWKRAILCGSK